MKSKIFNILPIILLSVIIICFAVAIEMKLHERAEEIKKENLDKRRYFYLSYTLQNHHGDSVIRGEASVVTDTFPSYGYLKKYVENVDSVSNWGNLNIVFFFEFKDKSDYNYFIQGF